jgi:protease secretion system membrane fusion protein
MSTSVQLSHAAAAAKSPAAVTDVEEVELKTDSGSAIRLGFWVLVVGFGLFLAWAAWAPLDEGVVAPSTVSIETRRKAIQHLQGGVVQQVAVKEGQEVKKGDVLVVLDDGAAKASVEAIRQNYLAQRALESRLLAELANAATIAFHPDLLGKSDPLVTQHLSVQQQIFASRRAAQASEIASAEQTIAGLEGQIAGMTQMLESRRQQALLQSRQLANVQALANDGFAPRNQALQLEQQQAELRASIADLETSAQRARSSIAEMRLRIAQRKSEYIREVSSQLADVRREVQANQERLVAITAELGRTQIRSPVDGQVVALALSNVGGVVTPGQKLMDIVPRDESLLLDAQVPPMVIDRVKVGDMAEVRFSSFANAPTLVVHGKVVSLSRDAVSDQIAGVAHTYFLARVEITPEGMKALGDRVLKPGMQAETLIKTGERSLLNYLLHPFTKRVAAAMTEE